MAEQEPPYSQKIYGIMKQLYGDKFTHTPESFEQKLNSDTAYVNKVYGIMREAYGNQFTHTPQSFADKLKKKGVTTQGSGQPVQQPGKPSAPSFGQKVVNEALTQEVQVPLKGQQKAPVQKKPYQDIYYKPEALPSETTQTVETPVIKAAKQDFKQTQVKPPVKPPVTEQGIKELEEKIKKPDETFLKFQDYQTSIDDLDDLENLYDADINTFQAKLSRRPDLYAKYSGRTEQETIDFFNALNDPNPLRQNEARVQWDVEKDAVYDNFVNDYKSLKSKHGKTVSDLDVMTDKLASDIVNEKTYKDFLAKREFAVSTTGAEATYGQVINMDEVDRVATEIVDGYGLPTDSDAWRLMKNKIKATVFSEYMKPKVQEELKRANPELLAKRQEIFEAGFEADDDIYAKTDSALNVLQTQYEQDAKREMDLINSEYVNTSKKLNQEYERYNANIEQQQSNLTVMRKNNQIDQLEYEAAFTKLEEDKKAFHNQYQANYPSYDEYVKKSNEINSRYNRKFEIQKKIITDKAQAELEAAYKKYAETYQEDPELLKQLNEAYKAAYDKVAKQDGEMMKLGASMSANPFSSLYNSTLSAMGGVFKGWGGSLNSKSLELLGETMEQNFTMPAPRTEDFSDWTDPQNVSMITGNVLGSMGPTMIPTAAAAIGTTFFTGGLGAPASVSMVTAGLSGALAGWGAETIDMAGRSYLDVFERSGGDVARANQAAKRTVKSQYDMLWAYSFEALPFIGKALKFIPTQAARVGVGGLVELGTEFTQEIRQNIAEENIVEFERDPWYNFDESINDERRRKQTLISIGPVALMGGAGQIGSKSIYQDRRDAAIAQQQKSALVNALPDQKRQYIQNMVFNRNGKFATNVIASLYAAGKIDEKQSADLMLEIQRAEQIKKAGKSAGLSGSKLNIYGFYSARAEEAERNAGRFANDPILKKSYEDMAKQYRDAGVEFMNGKNPDLLTLTYADGSQAIMMPEDVNALFADPIALSLLNQKAISIEAYDEKGQGPKIIEELRSRAETYAKSNRYTEASQIASPMQSLRQNINERIQQLYAERQELSEKQKQQEAERIRQEEIAAYEEKQKQRREEERGNRDIEIERLQEERAKIGVNEVDAFFSDMKPLVATMVERMEAGQPAPQSGVRAASDYLYAKYKELTAMKSDPNRMLTIAQIESIQAQIEQDLQTLEGNPPSQKTETRDQENIQGVSGQVGIGQEPVTAQPIEGPSGETTEAGGVLQAPGQEEVGPKKAAVENAQKQLEGVNSRINPNANHPFFNVGQKHSPGNKLIVTNSDDKRTDTTKDGVEVITKIVSPAEVDENGKMTKAAEVEIGIFDSYEQGQEYVNGQYNKYKAIAEEKLAKAKSELTTAEAQPTTEAAPEVTPQNSGVSEVELIMKEALGEKVITIDDIDQMITEKKVQEKCPPGYKKAAHGMVIGFIPGGKWDIVKEFKGKSHADGGIDIEISGGKIKYTGKTPNVKAKNGGFWNTIKDISYTGIDVALGTVGNVAGIKSMQDIIDEDQYTNDKFDKASNFGGKMVGTALKIIPVTAPIASAVGSAGSVVNKVAGIDAKYYDPTKHTGKLDKAGDIISTVGSVAGMAVNAGAAADAAKAMSSGAALTQAQKVASQMGNINKALGTAAKVSKMLPTKNNQQSPLQETQSMPLSQQPESFLQQTQTPPYVQQIGNQPPYGQEPLPGLTDSQNNTVMINGVNYVPDQYGNLIPLT